MTSPLSEVQRDSLQELFNRRPQDLSDADIEKIVQVLREQKANFDVEESKPKTPKRKKANDDLKLEDLGL
jgi:hypothetical protein